MNFTYTGSIDFQGTTFYVNAFTRKLEKDKDGIYWDSERIRQIDDFDNILKGLKRLTFSLSQRDISQYFHTIQKNTKFSFKIFVQNVKSPPEETAATIVIGKFDVVGLHKLNNKNRAQLINSRYAKVGREYLEQKGITISFEKPPVLEK